MAEEVVCRAARGDYMTEFQADLSYTEVMDGISYDDEDQEWAEKYLGLYADAFVSGVELKAKERSLIRQLLKRGHFGPFEHPQITFGVEGISRVCMAQITRHRHASFDVQSLRYTAPGVDDTIDHETVIEYIVIPPDLDADEEYVIRESAIHCFHEYQALIDGGMAKEDARFVLPLSTAVNLTVSMNARMLLHVFDMRLKADAQDEVIELSQAMLDEAHGWMPVTMEYYGEEMSPRKNQLSP